MAPPYEAGCVCVNALVNFAILHTCVVNYVLKMGRPFLNKLVWKGVCCLLCLGLGLD